MLLNEVWNSMKILRPTDGTAATAHFLTLHENAEGLLIILLNGLDSDWSSCVHEQSVRRCPVVLYYSTSTANATSFLLNALEDSRH